MQEKPLKLKELEYYLHYSDYLSREITTLIKTTISMETVNITELQVYWPDLNRKLQDEKELYAKNLGKTKSIKILTLIAVREAGHAIQLPKGRVEWLIERYAERNELAHSNVGVSMQEGHWGKLAEILYHDRQDLPIVIPPNLEEDILQIGALINTIIKRFMLLGKEMRRILQRGSQLSTK